MWGCEAHEVKQKKEKNYAVFQFEKYFLYIYDVITWGKEMYALYITTLSLSFSLSLSLTHTHTQWYLYQADGTVFRV